MAGIRNPSWGLCVRKRASTTMAGGQALGRRGGMESPFNWTLYYPFRFIGVVSDKWSNRFSRYAKDRWSSISVMVQTFSNTFSSSEIWFWMLRAKVADPQRAASNDRQQDGFGQNKYIFTKYMRYYLSYYLHFTYTYFLPIILDLLWAHEHTSCSQCIFHSLPGIWKKIQNLRLYWCFSDEILPLDKELKHDLYW